MPPALTTRRETAFYASSVMLPANAFAAIENQNHWVRDVTEVVRDLISRAAIALWNTEQVFQVADLEVGHAPSANFPCQAQVLKSRHDAGEVGHPSWPVQQIEIKKFAMGPDRRGGEKALSVHGVAWRRRKRAF